MPSLNNTRHFEGKESHAINTNFGLQSFTSRADKTYGKLMMTIILNIRVCRVLKTRLMVQLFIRKEEIHKMESGENTFLVLSNRILFYLSSKIRHLLSSSEGIGQWSEDRSSSIFCLCIVPPSSFWLLYPWLSYSILPTCYLYKFCYSPYGFYSVIFFSS